MFRRRIVETEISLDVLKTFMNFYIKVLQHQKDITDEKMKRYLFNVIEESGLPNYEIEQPEDVCANDFSHRDVMPIIHRRK